MDKSDFKCFTCGFCCELEIKLSRYDIIRISKIIPYNFLDKLGSGNYLKRNILHCIFYHEKKCSIYDFRPSVCRRFPFRKCGEMSQKCKQNNSFSSKVVQNIVMFMNKKNLET